jgi:putative nucleotidyltransferase with HDIG domain
MNPLTPWAEHLAQALLKESLPRRWAHVQGVAARARTLAPVLGADADLLHAAAWLHDIGYTPDLAVTGLHALDGARYLRDAHHADAMLCRLVAHHSYAIVEAGERGLADVLGREFEPAPYVLSSVLTCCDMTTSPDGELVPVQRRLAEIRHRYGPGHLVSRSIQRADDPPRSRAGSQPSRNGGTIRTHDSPRRDKRADDSDTQRLTHMR